MLQAEFRVSGFAVSGFRRLKFLGFCAFWLGDVSGRRCLNLFQSNCFGFWVSAVLGLGMLLDLRA